MPNNKKGYYIPYLKSVSRIKAGQWKIEFNGGSHSIRLVKTSFIFFLGANKNTGAIPLLFLQECSKAGVVIQLANTHQSESAPVVMTNFKATDKDNLLGKQILSRENEKTRAYIARVLVRRCFEGRQALVSLPETIEKNLGRQRSVKDVMQIEAKASVFFWERYYASLGLNGLTRREKHPVNAALDALSRYQAGIILRWVLMHGFSPAHGFLHTSTCYETVVYDLMEPYRWVFEKAVHEAYMSNGEAELIANSTLLYKQLLDEPVLVAPSSQKVYRRTELHGVVIALRYFLTGQMQRFQPPFEMEKMKRGRPYRCSYKLPGEIK